MLEQNFRTHIEVSFKHKNGSNYVYYCDRMKHDHWDVKMYRIEIEIGEGYVNEKNIPQKWTRKDGTSTNILHFNSRVSMMQWIRDRLDTIEARD